MFAIQWKNAEKLEKEILKNSFFEKNPFTPTPME